MATKTTTLLRRPVVTETSCGETTLTQNAAVQVNKEVNKSVFRASQTIHISALFQLTSGKNEEHKKKLRNTMYLKCVKLIYHIKYTKLDLNDHSLVKIMP